MPAGATADHLWQVVRHGGNVVELPRLIEKVPLSLVAERYLDSYPAGSKEDRTIHTEVTHLNSSNLSQLLRLRKDVIDREARLRLAGPPDHVWAVFLATGLDKVFDFATDTSTALAELQIDS